MSVFDSKKIGLVAVSLGKGGAERSVALLSRMLTQLGHEVHIVILNNQIDQNFSGVLFNLGKHKGENDNFLKRMLRFYKLRKYIQRMNFDLIIDHRSKNDLKRERYYKSYIYQNTKKIDVVHSALQAQYFEGLGEGFIKLFNANVASVAVSKYIQKQILEPRGIKNVVHIPNCADPSWIEQKEGLPELVTKAISDKKFFLSYGRIEDKIKDIRFLIKSFYESKLWVDNYALLIMGNGSDKKQLINEVASMKMQNHITFIAHIAHPASIIARAHAVCLTSYYEGFPMVLVESLSLGTPVVSLDINSGPSEIIKHNYNGLLISRRNSKDFANALILMAKDEQLYIQCKKNAQTSVEKFSMSEISKQWGDLIHRICSVECKK